MNNVLELKGKRFVQASKSVNGGGTAMNSQKIVTSEELLRLQSRIGKIKEFWNSEKKSFEGVLISVYYNKIVAKSNRISGLFKGTDSNSAIVGAKFNKEKSKHIITYYLDIKDLEQSMDLLSKTSCVLNTKFKGRIDKNIFDNELFFGNKKKNIILYNINITKSIPFNS